MTNHLHLLMTAERSDGIPAAMKRVAQRYVQHINRTYRRSGGLFEGRYRSALIDADSYLLACHRYIELNPVRASMVAAPGDHPWSSYRANALGMADAIIQPHPLYLALADTDQARRAAYRRLFEDRLSDEALGSLRESANGGFVLGPARFERQIAALVGRRTWKGRPGRPRQAIDDGEQGELPL